MIDQAIDPGLARSSIYAAALVADEATVREALNDRATMQSLTTAVKALLDAGASLDGVETPTDYGEVDALLRQRGHRNG